MAHKRLPLRDKGRFRTIERGCRMKDVLKTITEAKGDQDV